MVFLHWAAAAPWSRARAGGRAPESVVLASIPEGRHLDWANDPRPAPGRHRRRRYGPLAGADRVHHVSRLARSRDKVGITW